MKLSEAIRKGCEMVPNQSTIYQFRDPRTGRCEACAIGTALWAYYGTWLRDVGEAEWGMGHVATAQRIWPALTDALAHEIQDRNGWATIQQTREQIADWLSEQGL